MNAAEVRARWPLGARFVAVSDGTRRVRVVQSHVQAALPDSTDELLLAHERTLFWPSECIDPPPLFGAVPVPPPPPADRLREALRVTTPEGSNWQRLQERIAQEAEQARQREVEEQESRAQALREARRAREEAQARRDREERERVARRVPPPPTPPTPEQQARQANLRLEAKVAELQRLLNAATEALSQIQQEIGQDREMPMQSGKQEDGHRKLLIDGEEQENEPHNDG